MTQDTILFDDTIFNNIAYGSRGATPEEVEAAARQAQAHDFIIGLPKGYETRVGEAAPSCPAAQKQRLALARAILRDPSILILDEFTSQADAESEARIHRAAARVHARAARLFVITHRLQHAGDRRPHRRPRRRPHRRRRHAPRVDADLPLYQRLHEATAQRLAA